MREAEILFDGLIVYPFIEALPEFCLLDIFGSRELYGIRTIQPNAGKQYKGIVWATANHLTDTTSFVF